MYLFPGFKSGRRRHMCVEFVEGPIFCSERFISVYPGFLLSSKSNITKFQFEYHRAHRLSIFFEEEYHSFEVEYLNTDNVIAFSLSLTNKMRRNIFGARRASWPLPSLNMHDFGRQESVHANQNFNCIRKIFLHILCMR